MSVDDHTLTDDLSAPPVALRPPGRARRWRLRRRDRPPKPRLRKLRFLLILSAFLGLAVVSTLFGMLTAVASDLPLLGNRAQYQTEAVSSYLYDDQNRPIGILAPPDHPVLDTWQQINQTMVHAIVAVEDKRFWTDPGIDVKGIARAFVSDLTGGPHEGASTIAEQFVKNALLEQDNRTVFEKLREAALAFQLTHKWTRVKILTRYLNSIYFGNGAYGIESAARVYFGWNHGYKQYEGADQSPSACGDPNANDLHRRECADVLHPWEAALLAGMVANPTGYDPVLHRAAAMARRNLVLRDMFQQHYITRAQYTQGTSEPLPTAADLQQPEEPAAAPYFTSWVRPQIIAALQHEGVPAKLAAYKAFYGGLKIHLTIDLQLQEAAQQTINDEFPEDVPDRPTASLVAIDNRTGEVRAMVSSNGDYTKSPFNLATLGYRQPGSAFKPFTLAEALETGEYGPDSIITSAPQNFIVPHSAGKEHFPVRNFGNTYSGPITLAEATAISDNTVYSQVGIHVGTKRIATLAERMGIRTPVSHNYAMILGGLSHGVSPLDMAHAYETFATGGLRVYNPALGDVKKGPIGIHSIECDTCPDRYVSNHPRYKRVLPATVAATVHQLLLGVVGPGGTAPMAAIPGVDVVGKTGTTSNYVDAWFVGWTPQMTTAVWVGFPNSSVSMATDYNGEPVEGGTYPAILWHNFMTQALQILATEAAAAASKHSSTTTTPSTTAPISDVPTSPTTTTQTASTPSTVTNGAATTPTTANPGTSTTNAGVTTEGGGTAPAGGTTGGTTQGGGTAGGVTQGGSGGSSGGAGLNSG